MSGFSLDLCLEKLAKGEILPAETCKLVCEKAKEVLLQEPNVVNLTAPISVVGDVHGQFYDVLELFRVGGKPPDVNYLFLGDYVDRGHFSVETMSLLTCLKCRYPTRVFLLRGNHESRQITQAYGFYAECQSKYGSGDVWKYFTDMFDCLPIAALIDDCIFATHGGLSPSVHTLDHIRVLERLREVPHEGAFTDLMWSDPDPKGEGFKVSSRGAGYTFGRDIFDKFMELNGLDYMMRAHQLCQEGYQTLFDDSFATVWSAPNYCYRAGNLASVLEIDIHHNKFFNVFDACPATERTTITSYKPKTADYFL